MSRVKQLPPRPRLPKWLRIPIHHLATSARVEFGDDARLSRTALIGLMMPLMMMVLNGSMFSVALPAIRESFGVQADEMAWVMVGFTLSFVIFMPLYGRLGDGFSKRTLLQAGMSVFMLGSCVNILAPSLPLLLIGRIIQGAGASGVLPLTIAMISELFPARQRGKALGTWNSVGPGVAMVGPLLAGLLVDNWSWRLIFGPALMVGGVALLMVRRRVPAGHGNARPRFLRTFDWGGAALLSAALTTGLFYISSRPITGVPALRDWRLLVATCLLFTSFALWERRRVEPFIGGSVFALRPFTEASLCAAARMFANSSIPFLVPLYLTDVRGLSAAGIGLAIVIHAGALATAMRLGGGLADRWGSRRPVILGLSTQAGVMAFFALLPGDAALPLAGLGLVLHGLGAGLVQPALDRAAMAHIPNNQVGAAAGLYSMIRFGGTALGVTLHGLILQTGLDRGLLPIDAYHTAFRVITGVLFLGMMIALRLRE